MMTTQELKAILLAEHKRDINLMWKGYAVIGCGVLIILGLIVYLFMSLHVSFSGVVDATTGEISSGMPAYEKIVLPIGVLLCAGYAWWSYRSLQKRPEIIDTFVKHIENGTRVISIQEVKIYRIKIPLYIVNYHTGAVHSLSVVLEGVNKCFNLPVPYSYINQVKDLLNENS